MLVQQANSIVLLQTCNGLDKKNRMIFCVALQSMNAEDIAAAKQDLLSAVDTLTMEDVTLGRW